MSFSYQNCKIDGVGTSELKIVGLDNKTESVNIEHT